jgi:CheY-like chemotaxis protein
MLRFNSGLTRYVGPHEILSGLELAEVTDNDRLRHLQDKNVISLDTSMPPAGAERLATDERGGGELGRRSRQMRAHEAVAHIRSTPLQALEGFLSANEDRISVLRAMDAKRNG